MTDRTVHGQTSDGSEIVRYDRSGKWYIEPGWSRLAPRRLVSVTTAAILAAQGTPFLGLPGGKRFDSLVRTSTVSERSDR